LHLKLAHLLHLHLLEHLHLQLLGSCGQVL
jgi:hypothetical protein